MVEHSQLSGFASHIEKGIETRMLLSIAFFLYDIELLKRWKSFIWSGKLQNEWVAAYTCIGVHT